MGLNRFCSIDKKERKKELSFRSIRTKESSSGDESVAKMSAGGRNYTDRTNRNNRNNRRKLMKLHKQNSKYEER